MPGHPKSSRQPPVMCAGGGCNVARPRRQVAGRWVVGAGDRHGCSNQPLPGNWLVGQFAQPPRQPVATTGQGGSCPVLLPGGSFCNSPRAPHGGRPRTLIPSSTRVPDRSGLEVSSALLRCHKAMSRSPTALPSRLAASTFRPCTMPSPNRQSHNHNHSHGHRHMQPWPGCLQPPLPTWRWQGSSGAPQRCEPESRD
jgi:hypothetical protein